MKKSLVFLLLFLLLFPSQVIFADKANETNEATRYHLGAKWGALDDVRREIL